MSTNNNKDNLIASLRILNQIGASILSGLTVEEIIEKVYHHVNQLMDAYSFGIGIYNHDTKFFDYTGARENDIKMPFFSIDAHSPERFSGWVFANKSEILINDFDKEYCDMMVKGHKDAIDMFEKAVNECEDSDIKSWASSMLPGLRTHLEHAMTCDDKMKKM